MKILVACEFSQIVTKAFRKKGHEAYSCDIIPCEGGHPEWHIQDDVKNVLRHEFTEPEYDMIIAFPPCTYLTVTSNRWFKKEYKKLFPDREKKRLDAIMFFNFFTNLRTYHIAIENPIGIMSNIYRKPDQIIQPYYFGDPYKKSTCLWLKNLHPLIWFEKHSLFQEESNYVDPKFYVYNSKKTKSGKSKYNEFWKFGKRMSKERSIFPFGIAQAMADQWG